MDDDRMARDVEVLKAVMDHHGLTVAQVANRSGLAEKSIYKYLADVRTLPSDVIRAVFELSGDYRLISLITGCVPVECQVLQAKPDGRTPPSKLRTASIPPVDQLLEETCRAVELCAKATPYMGKIIQDGRVDKSDRLAIQQFHKHSAAARRCLALLDAALTTHLRKGVK